MNTNERKFSIIMTVYDQDYDLRENLPAFLEQKYEPGYEVIVVDESSTDETPDVLKLLKNDYKHLYTTFLPKPTYYVKRKMQSLNIGLKAAKNDWVIFANANHKPDGDYILQAIDDTLDFTAEVVLGYLTKKGIKLQSFDTCQEVKDYIIRKERKIQKVRTRKRKNYRFGRYDFIIIRKRLAIEILGYYEQSPSFWQRQAMRWHIFWKNLMSSYERITYLPKE
nr:glycosyltransferase family 2 protein [Xylanibacter ruminicola]